MLKSPFLSNIDNWRSPATSESQKLLLAFMFAMLTALGAKLNLKIWLLPFSLQTLFVYTSGLFLGWRYGAISQFLYLTAGIFLPVFAGDGYGHSYLFNGATSGYLLAFPLASGLIGWLSEHWNSFTGGFFAIQLGSFLLFFCGVVQIHFALNHPTWEYSFVHGWFKYTPVDLLKIIAATSIYAAARYWARVPVKGDSAVQ